MFGIIGEILSDAATALLGDNYNEGSKKCKLSYENRNAFEERAKNLTNQKIRALEEIDAETDPKIKRRMQMYYDDGIYDFSGIRNI